MSEALPRVIDVERFVECRSREVRCNALYQSPCSLNILKQTEYVAYKFVYQREEDPPVVFISFPPGLGGGVRRRERLLPLLTYLQIGWCTSCYFGASMKLSNSCLGARLGKSLACQI